MRQIKLFAEYRYFTKAGAVLAVPALFVLNLLSGKGHSRRTRFGNGSAELSGFGFFGSYTRIYN